MRFSFEKVIIEVFGSPPRCGMCRQESRRLGVCDSNHTELLRAQKVQLLSRHTVTTWPRNDYGPRGPASACSRDHHNEAQCPFDQFTSLRGMTNLRRLPLSRTRPSTGASLPYQQLRPHRLSPLPPPSLVFSTRPLSHPPLLQSAMFSTAWFRTNPVYCRVCLEFWPQEVSTLTVWSSAVPR